MIPADNFCLMCVEMHFTWNQERKRGFLLDLGRRSANNRAWCSSMSATGRAGACLVNMCTGVIAPMRVAFTRLPGGRWVGNHYACPPFQITREGDLNLAGGWEEPIFAVLYIQA